MSRNIRKATVRKLMALGAGAILSIALWLNAQDATHSPSVFLPPGALIYLEAANFRSLVNEWNSSTEKQRWLKSENYGVLSRSRLIQRLAEAQDQFASVAGIPVAYNLVNELAGGESAFAFYNLAELTFVYVTKLENTRLQASDLWKGRTRYEARSAAGIPFYLKYDPATHRSVAIAAYKNWFVIATAEGQMARTLSLLSGASAPSLASEPWFSEVASQGKSPGDLRLVYNLEALLPTPQFRTYWIQQNTSQLKGFRAGIADLFETTNAFEEKRVLLRGTAGDSEANQPPSLGKVLTYAPVSSSLYRAWSAPDDGILNQVLEQVVLGRDPVGRASDALAPTVSASVPAAGTSAGLETRIDQTPPVATGSVPITELTSRLRAMRPLALLHVQETVTSGDQVFVIPQSGLVIECERPDKTALDGSLSRVAGVLRTGNLDPLEVTVSDNLIILSRIHLTPSPAAPSLLPNTSYTAVFNKGTAWPNYKKLFALLERDPEMTSPDSARTPKFFSGNVRSLGDALSKFSQATVTWQEEGTRLRESIRYQRNAR